MPEQLNLFPETFDEQYERLNKRYRVKLEESQIAYQDLRNLLRTCPCTNKIKKEQYDSGTYYDYGYNYYWDECVICGKKFNVVEKCTFQYG